MFKHAGYYVILIAILIFGFLLVFTNQSNKIFQIGAVVAVTFFYILWGMIHHLLNHDLNVKIVIEYILIGTFGLTIIFFLFSNI